MKRMLCIVGSMSAGGAETFLMKMYRKLDKSKYQMDFAVAKSTEGFYDKEIGELGGEIYHITPKTKGLLKNFDDVRKLVKDNNYLYVLRTSQHSLSALELLAARLGGAKIRIFRSSNSNTTSSSRTQALIHKMCMFMPQCFANVRIAPSTEAAEFMFGKGCVDKGKAKLIHNGVDTAIFKYTEKDRSNIRREFNIDENSLVVGHVGRFNQQKNHTFLIEIFSEIIKINSNAVLMLVGEGKEIEAIKNKVKSVGIENNVIFTGVRRDIPALLSAFDVFAFPSFYEGMPNTVIEAQSTGLPCVIADTITKEVDFTGLVHYMSLQDSAKQWAETVLKYATKERIDTKDFFWKEKYDIDSVVEQFIRLCYMDNIN